MGGSDFTRTPHSGSMKNTRPAPTAAAAANKTTHQLHNGAQKTKQLFPRAPHLLPPSWPGSQQTQVCSEPHLGFCCFCLLATMPASVSTRPKPNAGWKFQAKLGWLNPRHSRNKSVAAALPVSTWKPAQRK